MKEKERCAHTLAQCNVKKKKNIHLLQYIKESAKSGQRKRLEALKIAM